MSTAIVTTKPAVLRPFGTTGVVGATRAAGGLRG